MKTNDLKKHNIQKSMCKNNFILDKMLKTLKRENQRSFFFEMKKTHKHHDLDQNYVDYRHDEIYDSKHYERKKRFKYSKLSSFDENRIE